MRKRFGAVMSLIVMLMTLLVGGAFAKESNRVGVIRADKVNVRSKPSTDSEIIGTLNADTQVLVTGSKRSFYKIYFKEKEGYVSDEFLSIVESRIGRINAQYVIVREEASTDSDKITTLDKDDTINVVGERNDFYKAVGKFGIGYVSKDYVDVGSSNDAKIEDEKEEQLSVPEEKEQSDPEPTEGAPVVRMTGGGEYTEEELYLVAQLIYCEHRNSTAEGFDAIASVVYNRLQSKKFPNNIEEIVFQPNQFTVTSPRDKFLETKPSSGAIEAVKRVFVEGIVTLPEEVMFFKSARLSKSWGSRVYYATIDGHMYYS